MWCGTWKETFVWASLKEEWKIKLAKMYQLPAVSDQKLDKRYVKMTIKTFSDRELWSECYAIRSRLYLRIGGSEIKQGLCSCGMLVHLSLSAYGNCTLRGVLELVAWCLIVEDLTILSMSSNAASTTPNGIQHDEWWWKCGKIPAEA